jgi:hypothetical protein
VHDAGGWRTAGADGVAVFMNGARAPDGLGALPRAI